MSVEEKVKEILKCDLSIKDEILYSDSLSADLDLDSLEIIELVMALEDDFKVSIPDEDCEAWVTVGDVIEYMENLVQPKGGVSGQD